MLHQKRWSVHQPAKSRPSHRLASSWHARCRSLTATAAKGLDLAVVARDVHLAFGKDATPVLKGLNLDVKRGSLHMLLGPNGCGKSTLLRVLGGLMPADRGSVTTDMPTGFVFQNPDHQVVMPTVAADVAFGLGRYDMPEGEVKQAVASALELVNMQDAMNRGTHTLSGGQRQRVAIAGALAENPRLLLLDELTTFLDVEDQFGVLEAVRSVTRRGCVTSVASIKQHALAAAAAADDKENNARNGNELGQSNRNSSGSDTDNNDRDHQPVTAIWVTHRFEELQYADSASYMQDGRVVLTGTGHEMLEYLKQLGAPV